MISIHSAIASGDGTVVPFFQSVAISIHSAIASGDPKGRIILAKLFISIHSAIASGDIADNKIFNLGVEFQSTPPSLAETRIGRKATADSIHFNPLRHR